MNERRYCNLVFVLSLLTLMIVLFPFILSILEKIDVILLEPIKIHYKVIFLVFWLLGLPIAVIAFKMGRQIKRGLLLRRISRALSFLAILAYVFFLIGILASLFLHLFPREY